MRQTSLAVLVFSVLLLVACSVPTVPVAPPAFVDTVGGAERLAEVEKIAGAQDDELTIQPLRDPMVDDLREQAFAARQRGDLGIAAAVLEQALTLVDGDPGILQERAELALLSREPARAEHFSRAALALGSRTGPLCRRHWATIWQSWLARNDEVNAASAHAQIPGCTVAAIERF